MASTKPAKATTNSTRKRNTSFTMRAIISCSGPSVGSKLNIHNSRAVDTSRLRDKISV